MTSLPSVSKSTVMERYVPPPVGEGQDELEHYKMQVRIMADHINVSGL